MLSWKLCIILPHFLLWNCVCLKSCNNCFWLFLTLQIQISFGANNPTKEEKHSTYFDLRHVYIGEFPQDFHRFQPLYMKLLHCEEITIQRILSFMDLICKLTCCTFVVFFPWMHSCLVFAFSPCHYCLELFCCAVKQTYFATWVVCWIPFFVLDNYYGCVLILCFVPMFQKCFPY